MAARSNQNYCVKCDAHVSNRTLPVNFNAKDANLFTHEFTRAIPESYAKFEQDVNIVNHHLFSLFGNKKFSIYSKSSTAGRRDKILQSIKNLQVLKPPRVVTQGTWITDDWSEGYFHWFTDALTRLELVNRYWDRYPVLLPSHYRSISYIEDSLRILGVQYTYLHRGGRSLIQDLLLTSYTADTGNYNKQLLNQLSNRFKKWASEMSPGRDEKRRHTRIFVSRALASRRRLTNESELVPIFKDHGFEIINSENLSFEAQVKLYSSSAVLAGLHGAGLTNMLFMPRGSSIVEIRRESDYHNNCYFTLSSDLDHKYYYLMAKPSSENFNSGDCLLNPKELSHLLSTLAAE